MIDDALIEYCVDMLEQLADMLDEQDEHTLAAALRALAKQRRAAALHNQEGDGAAAP